MSWIFDTTDVDAQHLELEAQFAQLFLRAGGMVTRRDWDDLTPLEAMALVLANDRLQVERAIQLATAQGGPVGIAKVMEPVDNGEMLRELTLAQLLGKAMARA